MFHAITGCDRVSAFATRGKEPWMPLTWHFHCGMLHNYLLRSQQQPTQHQSRSSRVSYSQKGMEPIPQLRMHWCSVPRRTLLGTSIWGGSHLIGDHCGQFFHIQAYPSLSSWVVAARKAARQKIISQEQNYKNIKGSVFPLSLTMVSQTSTFNQPVKQKPCMKHAINTRKKHKILCALPMI